MGVKMIVLVCTFRICHFEIDLTEFKFFFFLNVHQSQLFLKIGPRYAVFSIKMIVLMSTFRIWYF